MTEETVTVWHEGMGVTLYKDVAEELGFESYRSLTEREFWRAIKANAEYGIARCRAEIAKRKATN